MILKYNLYILKIMFNLILPIIIIIIIIYIKFGLLVLIQLIIMSIVLFASNLLIGINPNSKEMHIIRLMSIIYIIFIFYINSNQSDINLAFIIPISSLFSQNRITLLDDWFDIDNVENPTDIIYVVNSKFTWFHFNDFKEISDFLDILEHDKIYIVSFDIILDKLSYEFGDPTIVVSKPILITKESNPWLISRFLNERIVKSCDSYGLEEDWLKLGNDSPGILVRYKEINLNWK